MEMLRLLRTNQRLDNQKRCNFTTLFDLLSYGSEQVRLGEYFYSITCKAPYGILDSKNAKSQFWRLDKSASAKFENCF